MRAVVSRTRSVVGRAGNSSEGASSDPRRGRSGSDQSSSGLIGIQAV